MLASCNRIELSTSLMPSIRGFIAAGRATFSCSAYFRFPGRPFPRASRMVDYQKIFAGEYR